MWASDPILTQRAYSSASRTARVAQNVSAVAMPSELARASINPPFDAGLVRRPAGRHLGIHDDVPVTKRFMKALSTPPVDLAKARRRFVHYRSSFCFLATAAGPAESAAGANSASHQPVCMVPVSIYSGDGR